MLLRSYATVYYISGLALPTVVAFTTLICDESCVIWCFLNLSLGENWHLVSLVAATDRSLHQASRHGPSHKPGRHFAGPSNDNMDYARDLFDLHAVVSDMH